MQQRRSDSIRAAMPGLSGPSALVPPARLNGCQVSLTPTGSLSIFSLGMKTWKSHRPRGARHLFRESLAIIYLLFSSLYFPTSNDNRRLRLHAVLKMKIQKGERERERLEWIDSLVSDNYLSWMPSSTLRLTVAGSVHQSILFGYVLHGEI